MKITAAFLIFLYISLCSSITSAENVLDRFKERISRFTLANGVTFLVAERHRAPVASFVTFVDTGGVDEPKGHTGMAHFLEHMAFKGTPEIGTRNWEKEKALLKKVDEAYADWLRADLIRNLKSNLGLAAKLAEAEAQMGGWEQVFALLEQYQKVKAEDVRAVAGKYLIPDNRTSGRLLLQADRKGEE